MTNAWVREDSNNRTIVFLENKETSKRYFWNTLLKRFSTLCFAIVVLLSILNSRDENSGLRDQVRDNRTEQVCRSGPAAALDQADAERDNVLADGWAALARGDTAEVERLRIVLEVANDKVEFAIINRNNSLTECLVD